MIRISLHGSAQSVGQGHRADGCSLQIRGLGGGGRGGGGCQHSHTCGITLTTITLRKCQMNMSLQQRAAIKSLPTLQIKRIKRLHAATSSSLCRPSRVDPALAAGAETRWRQDHYEERARAAESFTRRVRARNSVTPSAG